MANYMTFTRLLNDYKSIVWQNQDLFKYYERLKNHLEQNLGEDIACFFAEPYITEDALKGNQEALWIAAQLTDEAQPLTGLPDEEQTEARVILENHLSQIQQYTQKLLKSNDADDKKWGELINQALIVPDESHILVDGDHLALVVWGFQLEKAFNLGQQLAAADEKEEVKTLIDEPVKETETAQTRDIVPDQPKEEKVVEKKEETTAKEESNTKNKKDENPEQPWWKRVWWLWLGALLLLVLVSSLRQCSTKKTNPLPAQPGKLVPIDSAKITEDPKKARSIVADRLNVALTGSNKNVTEFAKAFKTAYPEANYKVIYYDTLTHRLQLEVPASVRENIKKDLPTKLDKFKMLIWYEGIFQRNYKPNDPGFENRKQSWHHEMVKAFGAWEVTRGDSNLVVAVIDDGFDLTHPEFKGKIYKPWNVPAYSDRVNTERASVHGTHVAGVAIGLADNGKGASGIAPNCRFMPVQVGDANGLMSTTAIIDAVLYAINNGADVVNLSLGMMMPRGTGLLSPRIQREIINSFYKDEEAFWNDLFKVAYDKNVMIVLAAGNQNLMVGLDPMQRSPHTIKVSAVDLGQNKARFSNYGDKSTISAPGVQIYSSLPGNTYNYLDGTSMAAPVVTGGIALIKSANPTMTHNDIVDLLQSTGIPVSSSARMGNIIQLDRALGITQKGRDKMPKVDCPDAQSRIDELAREIEKIKQACQKDEGTGDTLRIPTDPKEGDFKFAVGRWKSTTYLYSTEDGEKVTIYFDFYSDGTGKVTLTEPNGRQCSADLSLALLSGQFNINQTLAASCMPPPKTYTPYTFECKTDENGYAECIAQNKVVKANRFKFRLVKIR